MGCADRVAVICFTYSLKNRCSQLTDWVSNAICAKAFVNADKQSTSASSARADNCNFKLGLFGTTFGSSIS